VNMNQQWNYKDREKTETAGEKPVTLPHCSPQISHRLDMGANTDLRCGIPKLVACFKVH
jgi:hypothetical protein